MNFIKDWWMVLLAALFTIIMLVYVATNIKHYSSEMACVVNEAATTINKKFADMNIKISEQEKVICDLKNHVLELDRKVAEQNNTIHVFGTLLLQLYQQKFIPYRLKVTATAYTNSPDEISEKYHNGKTALNIPVGLGVIAVDPEYIPLGTIVWIPQFKRFFIAMDTGNKIKGNRIDIYLENKMEAKKFGKNRNLEIWICGKLDDNVLRELSQSIDKTEKQRMRGNYYGHDL